MLAWLNNLLRRDPFSAHGGVGAVPGKVPSVEPCGAFSAPRWLVGEAICAKLSVERLPDKLPCIKICRQEHPAGKAHGRLLCRRRGARGSTANREEANTRTQSRRMETPLDEVPGA